MASSMRYQTYISALFCGAFAALGCSGDPDPLGGAHPSGGPRGSRGTHAADAGTDGGAEGDGPAATAPVASPAFGDQAVARAREWVAAQMPYCGGPNGGHDVICGGTCARGGNAQKAEWDAYRSDCSGLLSYSWGLPAPGSTCATLAPFDTSVSEEITVDELTVGDALNNHTHTMLFAGWADRAAGKAIILEESKCGRVALEKIVTFTRGSPTVLDIQDTTGRSFNAIRRKR